MKTSEEIEEIAKALIAVVAGIGPIVKEGWNPDTKSKYASFNVIIEKVRPELVKAGVLLVQGEREEFIANYVDIETRLIHAESGQWIANMVRMPLVGRRRNKDDGGGYWPADPQSGGSALTYGKRYGLLTLLGLVADEDDDGQGAKPRTAQAVKKAREERSASQTGQLGQQLVEGIMPVGGPTQKGKPIADMPIGVLRSALQHCRSNNKRNEARIIAAELTKRSLGGDKKAEQTIRAAAAEDDNIADAAQQTSEKIKGVES